MIVGVVFILIIIIALIANGIDDYNKDRTVVFHDIYPKLNLPIVTLENNSKKFNFLVDTGANLSILNSAFINEFEYEELKGSGTVYGMEGNIQHVTYVRIILHKGEDSFLNRFQLVDLTNSFGKIGDEYNVDVHGILGNDFLVKYGCIINYPKLKMKYDLSSN